MKKTLPFFLILFFTIYLGCSNNLVSPSLSNTSESGQVALKISSDSIPNNVVKVTAILSQSGEDTLTSSIEPISGSSAELSFTNVSVGTWHLKVNADNNSGVILYTGETDIQINAGEITNVQLTLMPTGNGTGSIYISVNWGGQTPSWLDYQNNPVLSVKDIPYFTLAVDQAQVIYDNGLYKMWFTNLYNSGHGDISYAESYNGITWRMGSNEPVLTAGQSGTWDDYSVDMGCVLKDNGIYKLYYIGMQDAHTGVRQIGLATSNDGIHWQKYPNPILISNTNQYYMGVHSVLKINNIYYMYYDASPENDYKFNINLATSTDGLNWNRYSNNPILTPNQSWENNDIHYPTVVKKDDLFIMCYGNDVDGFGIAYSNDGINWTKNTGNPVFSLSDVSNNWCSKISYPFSVMAGNNYKVYYSGLGNDGQYHLGVAFKQ